MDKVKIDVKLPIFDGTPDTCTDWFFLLEKNLGRMSILRDDNLFYASGHTMGIGKEAVCVLQNKHSDNYSLVKAEIIEIFDVLKNYEVYEQFLQNFKQAHTETATSFFVKYQSQSQHLVLRGIWPDDISTSFAINAATVHFGN